MWSEIQPIGCRFLVAIQEYRLKELGNLNCRCRDSPRKSWPPVVTDGRIIRLEGFDVFNFLPANLRGRGGFRFPEYLSPNREVFSLLSGKVFRNEKVSCATEVVDAIRQIFADIDLAIRVRDFVDHFHRQFYCLIPLAALITSA
jgi:hypothetical protein